MAISPSPSLQFSLCHNVWFSDCFYKVRDNLPLTFAPYSGSSTNPCFSYPSSFSLQVRKYKGMILEDLENALAEHAPPGGELTSELPPLTIDGIPVSVDKMTQVSP